MSSTKGIRAGRAFVEIFADDSKLVRWVADGMGSGTDLLHTGWNQQ